uniref:RNA-dependent RNA polymerase n=1 Tax=Brassica campestris chinensis cryptic virus 1 TaxID=2894928 RepID=A0A8K1Z7E2_9VIRU|nr:RNA-dependent RNA polymerase [Brassica campestris chinensis cryptic virus 1]
MDKSTININGYEFREFQGELEDLNQTHSEQIRREPEVTYFDEFAKAEFLDLYPEYYRQYVEGWSRSYYMRSKHMESIFKFSNQNHSINELQPESWQHAIEATRDGLSILPRVRALSVKTELDQVKYIQSSAAGYGYIGAKGPLYGENHDRAIRRAKATLYSATAEDGQGIDYAIRESVPDVGYTRTQLADLTEKTKVRGVWGRAFHYILLEGTSARPLIEAIQEGQSFIMIGSDPIVNVPYVLTETKALCKWLMSLDWSSFDATVNRFEINAAFDLMKEHLVFPDFDTEMAYELCRQIFTHKKVAAPDGKIYWSHKGIPSGSYFTSLVGSIVNKLRVEYLWHLKFGRSPKVTFTLGDDSLIGDDHYYPPDELADKAYNLGWLVNPDKTEYSTLPGSITFLGRSVLGSVNQRELKKCIQLLLLPEFPVESGEISAFRAAAIANDAGGNSEMLNRVARRLKRKYGIAETHQVPLYFRRYQP